jgi:hypothetical protein
MTPDWLLLWSSGQGSWLQIQRSGFDSRRYHVFWELVGPERVPLSLVNTVEELLGWKISGSGLERLEYGHRDPSCWTPSIPKIGTNFADKRRSLGWYSSLADSCHGVFSGSWFGPRAGLNDVEERKFLILPGFEFLLLSRPTICTDWAVHSLILTVIVTMPWQEHELWEIYVISCSFVCLLYGLVVRVLGYRSGGPGSIPGTTRKKVVGLERGPLSLVSTTEELLDRKVAAPV